MVRKSVLAGLLAAAVAGPAMAADVAVPAPIAAPEAWAFDLAFGAKIMSDYNFRGISQSARGPAGGGYAELRYGWLYAGTAFWTTKLPTRPTGEVDFYGGIRPVFGNLSLDLGVMYYYYPSETQFITANVGPAPAPVIVVPPPALAGVWTPRDTDFWEFYGKAGYDITPEINVGAAIYYAPNWLRTGISGTYGEINAKVKLPNDFAISGALGHYWFGAGLQDYLYWNAGISYTFRDTVTFDVRYHGTNLSPEQCFGLTGDYRGVFTGSGRSNWCGHSVVASLSVDLLWSKLPFR